MKKVLLLLIALTLGFGVKAQTSLTTAVDFTATDIEGNEIHLFDILDNGQYVLIEFYRNSCPTCQQTIASVVSAYHSLGCNLHEVFFMEISTEDNNTVCQTWVNTHDVEYPTIGTTGGSVAICSQYGFTYVPTLILIAPDRSIVIQDLWPVNNAQSVISALATYGIEQHDCTAPNPEPEVTITIDQVLENEVTATFTPNELCAMYYYTIATDEEIQQWLAVASMELPEYLQNYGFPADDVISHTFTDLTPETEYTIYAVPADASNVLGDVVTETVTTGGGGGGEIMPDFTATDIDGNEINLYSILDGGQAVLINFFLSDDQGSLFMPFINEAFTLFGCNENDVFFMEICPDKGNDVCQTWVDTYGVKFPTISRDGGGNDIVQSIPVALFPAVMIINPDHTIAYRDLYPLVNTQTIIDALEGEGYGQHECFDAIAENALGIMLYPNPANESMILKGGESLGIVKVYDVLGKIMDEFEANGTELLINTSRYENGFYFLKAGETTLRFVVTH